eukprot:CCRYP_019098-RA/>CCRYP_019098-RA protein AED:0.44 eAED:0.44 QI:0/0/0/1/0/0/2/0/207
MSSARHLFALVLELKVQCMLHEVYLHVCHISGDRMITTGVDGWSRGDFETGVSLGHDLHTFLPLALSAEKAPGNLLARWLKSWMGKDNVPTLTPEGWFYHGHLPGIHVWMPPPATALIALKQLAQAKHKRPYTSTHVEEWQMRFEKEVDIWFVLSTGSHRPLNAHEPLLVGLSFPLYSSFQWQLRLESKKVVDIGRSLSALSKKSHV